MERKTRLKLKMIVSLFTCVLSLFSLVTLSLAWFAMNGKTDADGMNVIIKKDKIVSACEYFVADNRETQSGTAGYSFVTATAEDKNRLGTYDVLGDKYQFLIKVNLASATTVKVSAKTETDYFLGSASAKDGEHLLTADGTGNALSSVVSFAVLNREDLTANDNGNGYKIAALPENTSCFFDRSASALESATEPFPVVTLTPENGLNVTADENGNAYFFIMLSYDPLLVSTVFAANIGNDVIGSDVDVPFVLDFEIGVSAA